MRTAILALTLTTVLSSCEPESSAGNLTRETLPGGAVLLRYPDLPAIDADSPDVTEAQVDLQFGSVEGTDPNLIFADIRGIQAASDGTIYVLDFQATEVRAYDPGGQARPPRELHRGCHSIAGRLVPSPSWISIGARAGQRRSVGGGMISAGSRMREMRKRSRTHGNNLTHPTQNRPRGIPGEHLRRRRPRQNRDEPHARRPRRHGVHLRIADENAVTDWDSQRAGRPQQSIGGRFGPGYIVDADDHFDKRPEPLPLERFTPMCILVHSAAT